MVDVAGPLFAAPEGGAEALPVRGPVAGAAEAGGIHEGLHQPGARPEPRGPVLREAGQGPGQHVGGEVPDRDPGEDEKAAVVDHPVQVGVPLGRGPADPLVPHAQDAGGGAEGQSRHGAALEARQVLEAMAEQLPIPEIMIAAHQPVPERLHRRVARQLDRNRRRRMHRALHRRGVEGGLVRRDPSLASRSQTVRHADLSPGPRHRTPVLPNATCALGTRIGPSLTRPDASYITCDHVVCLEEKFRCSIRQPLQRPRASL